jgi:hypothetical protein
MFQLAALLLGPVAALPWLRHISEAVNKSSVVSHKFIVLLFRGSGLTLLAPITEGSFKGP